jgi:GNAT superfamily N-acetyltransferase
MEMTLQVASKLAIPDMAGLFNHAFTGYIGGAVEFTPETMHSFLVRDNVDLNASSMLMDDGRPVGFILLARQGWTSRVAAMGMIPEAQSKGLGRWFMERVIEQAKAQDVRTLVLEAFEQNERAVKLYMRVGFRIVRRLYGYHAELMVGQTADLTEVDIYDVARLVMEHGLADLPWQVSGTALARLSPPNRAYRLGDAYAVVSDPSKATVALRSLFVLPEARLKSEGTRLVEGLFAMYPGKAWHVPQICPEEYDGFFIKHGFARLELHQVQMAMRLEG